MRKIIFAGAMTTVAALGGCATQVNEGVAVQAPTIYINPCAALELRPLDSPPTFQSLPVDDRCTVKNNSGTDEKPII